LGSVVEVAQARYEAARLLQRIPDGHGEAVVFFEALLAEPSSLRGLQPEIRLHLSRSLREVGRAGEADALLQELVARWPATAAAEIARGELSAETH
jgi:TolA-binding protein